MTTHPSELEQFQQFVAQKVADGNSGMTPEECLDVWRAAHPTIDDLQESTAAIERGLDQARRGEGVPLQEFARDFREKMPIRRPNA